jgi:hypothetical protein
MRFLFWSTKKFASARDSSVTMALPPAFTPRQRTLVDGYFRPRIGAPKESLVHKLALRFGSFYLVT